MSHPLFPFVVGAVLFWIVLTNVMGKIRKTKDQPAPAILRRAADIDSLGLTAAMRAARNNDPIQQTSTEVHMNAISAVVFLLFVGGAVLSHLSGMPIALTIVLALIGVFMGYSIKMAQQWERAVVLRLGDLTGSFCTKRFDRN